MNDIPVWAGWLIIAAFLLVSTLIAVFYNWIWYDLLQRFEPFTLQLGRICAKRPWLWYGFMVLVIAWVITTALVAPWWVRVIFVFVTGFFGWFMPHIAAAACDPDNPYHLVRAFKWAERKEVFCGK